MLKNDVYKKYFKQGTDGNVSAFLENGDTIKQQGIIKIELLDENQEKRYESIWDTTKIKNNPYIEIAFEPIPLSFKGEIYTLRMMFKQMEIDSVILFT